MKTNKVPFYRVIKMGPSEEVSCTRAPKTGKNGQAKGRGHRFRQGTPRRSGKCDRPEHVQEQDGGRSGRDAGQMAWRSRSSV